MLLPMCCALFHFSYKIMLSCWKRDPLERPSFSNLVLQTSELLQDMKDYLPLVTLQQESMMDIYQDQSCAFVAEETKIKQEETAQ